MRTVTDAERRARLARRHGLAPAARLPDPVAATRAMTVLHATEAASVHLAVRARTRDVAVQGVERALYDDRSLVKQLAMRRTLFVFPRDLLPAAWGSAAARVAAQQRARLAKEVVAAGLADDGEAWLGRAREAVLHRLADGSEVAATELREQLPALAGRVDLAPGTRWGGSFPVAPRVLTWLGAEGEVVRGTNAGPWRVSRPRWTLTRAWLGEVPAPLDPDEGHAELARRWLATFGPGTTRDLQWWLGGTLATARRALADVGAAEVGLEDGSTAWVLPDDDPEPPAGEPWAALLPVLDPTLMGWKERGFLLGGHGPALFDASGNAGTTAWWDGRVVGCWVQDEGGTVHVRLLEEVPPAGRRALADEAARLTGWLDGERVAPVYLSPAMKAARAQVAGSPAAAAPRVLDP